MTFDEYLKLMKFPSEWQAWEMLPRAFVAEQMSLYQPGHENTSEHDRHGVFQWWLHQTPSASELVQLARLSWLDPDQKMAAHVRAHIETQPYCTAEVLLALTGPTSE